jgi:hypothetical protein
MKAVWPRRPKADNSTMVSINLVLKVRIYCKHKGYMPRNRAQIGSRLALPGQLI